jgi:mRNA interferase HigB
MDLLGKQLLYDFKKKYAETCSQIDSWIAEVEEAQWNTPHDLKQRYPKVSLPGNQNAVFDFCWNKYRLWVLINYKNKIVLVKKVGTHKEYDKWHIN